MTVQKPLSNINNSYYLMVSPRTKSRANRHIMISEHNEYTYLVREYNIVFLALETLKRIFKEGLRLSVVMERSEQITSYDSLLKENKWPKRD